MGVPPLHQNVGHNWFITFISAAESVSQRKREEELFQAVREGDMDKLVEMVSVRCL